MWGGVLTCTDYCTFKHCDLLIQVCGEGFSLTLTIVHFCIVICWFRCVGRGSHLHWLLYISALWSVDSGVWGGVLTYTDYIVHFCIVICWFRCVGRGSHLHWLLYISALWSVDSGVWGGVLTYTDYIVHFCIVICWFRCVGRGSHLHWLYSTFLHCDLLIQVCGEGFSLTLTI